MNCLTDRDGVSNTTIEYDFLLKNNFPFSQIIGKWSTPKVSELTRQITDYDFKEHDVLVYHYWNYCEVADFANNLELPAKVFFFHNITPTSFFESDDEAFKNSLKGYKQLPIFDNFDVYVCQSEFSAQILKQLIPKEIKTYVLPPILEKEKIVSRKFTSEIVESHKGRNFTHIIFVSSIAPHKKQDDLVEFFSYYIEKVDKNAQLTIIGGGNNKYVDRIKNLIDKKGLVKKIHLTGKVSNEDLYAYYRTADVYLSMCEHEGFGVPLVDAMAFDIPVIAFDNTAIGETIGENGCLFKKKDFKHIASIIQSLVKNPSKRANTIECQNHEFIRYSVATVLNGFKEIEAIAIEERANRINKKIAQGDFTKVETIQFNDNRLVTQGDWQIVDNLFLCAKISNGVKCIEFEASFELLELHFLTHEWSGMVKVEIDGDTIEVLNLYSDQSKIKSYFSDKKFTAENHFVRLTQLLEKDSNSKGFEVLFNKVVIKAPYINTGILYEDMLEEIVPFIENKPDYLDTYEEDALDISKHNILRTRHDWSLVNNSEISFQGFWEIRDLHYFFTCSHSFIDDNHLTFSAKFSRLDILALTHGWSGSFLIEIDGSFRQEVSLYSAVNLTDSVIKIDRIFANKEHEVKITILHKKDKKSKGYEAFLKEFHFYSYEEIDIDQKALKENYKISVNINTMNRCQHVERLLLALEEQTYPYFEVVVVNGPSTDDTDKLLERYAGKIKVGKCPEANLSWSRNVGIEISSGDYIAFIDDDALPCDKYWLENYANYLIANEGKNIGIVGGPVKDKDSEYYEFKSGATSEFGFHKFSAFNKAAENFDNQLWISGVQGCNNIVKKAALFDINGFDTTFIYYLDETDICFSLYHKGYSIHNNGLNFVRHYKATGVNRKSRFDIRWDIITRSDTYFSLKTPQQSLLSRFIKTCQYLKKKHFYKELKAAYFNKQISSPEYKKYRRLLLKGFRQGLTHYFFGKKRPQLIDKGSINFTPFNSLTVLEIDKKGIVETFVNH